jgi:hypothetical protein
LVTVNQNTNGTGSIGALDIEVYHKTFIWLCHMTLELCFSLFFTHIHCLELLQVWRGSNNSKTLYLKFLKGKDGCNSGRRFSHSYVYMNFFHCSSVYNWLLYLC